MRIALVVLGGLVALALGIAAGLGIAGRVGEQRMRGLYEADRAHLLGRADASAPIAVDPVVLATLPEPVRRYVEVTGAAARPGIRGAVLRQSGTLRTGRDRPWMPFTAEQVYAADPPGFSWFAVARFLPLVPIVARDHLVEERGAMLIRLLGLVTVADASGPALDQGAGLRFWGELLSFPETVTHPRLAWAPVDARRARVRVAGETPLEGVLEFGEDGLPAAFHADRLRETDDGRVEPTPWTGAFLDWRMLDGRLYPVRWTATWHLPDGDFEAVRMEISGVEVR